MGCDRIVITIIVVVFIIIIIVIIITRVWFTLDLFVHRVHYDGTSLSVLLQGFFSEGRVSVGPSARQSRRIASDQFFFRTTIVTTSYGIELVDFNLQPTITTFDMVMPSRSTGEGYLPQIVELHPVEEIPWTDLFLGGDTARTADYSPVVALQIMQIRWGWGPGSACMEKSSPGGDGKWSGGEDGHVGRGSLNWLHATRHLVMAPSSQPPLEDNQSPR